MKRKTLKYYLKLSFILCLMSYVVIACQQDDLNEIEKPIIQNTSLQSPVRIQTGNNVSEHIINYIKQKTNNSLRVYSTKDYLKLTDLSNVEARESALGTVDTSKELIVVNEYNTKHTFKVIDQSPNSITNIIVVETQDHIFEYFLKYTFDEEIPYDDKGMIDLSRFNGTIDTFDADGNRTGGLSFSNGEVIDGDGQTSPCPEDIISNPNNNNNNDDQTGGSTQTDDPAGNDPSDNDDSGGGGWFDGGPDWPCGLNYTYHECTGGANDVHAPRPNSALDGGMCSGSLLVVTDCNGTLVSSTYIYSRELSNPCNGPAGVLLGDKETHAKNCEKLAELANNEEIMESFNFLQGQVSDENITQEFGFAYSLDQNPIELHNVNELKLTPEYGGLIYGMSHTHPYEDSQENKVHPMFSFEDIFNLVKLAELHTLLPKNFNLFVLTLTVKKENTSETYALKFSSWFEFRPFIDSYAARNKNQKKSFRNILKKKYDDLSDDESVGNDSNSYLKELFKFLNEENVKGLDIYKATDESLSQWKKQKYDPDENEIIEINCNN